VIDYPAPCRRLPRQNLWLAEVRHKGGLAKAGAHIRNRTSFSFPIAKAISRNGGLGSRRLKHSAEGASLLLSGPKVWRFIITIALLAAGLLAFDLLRSRSKPASSPPTSEP
jgi:hypothetical protein